ncbi:hypothetical protein PR048_021004 [Dryococelus australis]|uniref:DUF5641 domain-containing protein n=1 Tax=Dryococelus australis TaxID=614101 RepID=A0ABQ9GX10_9NEOP|nr:hypothetical protein PR048_021004 [Dryococelus australis]
MAQTVKRLLSRMLGIALLALYEFYTIICKSESIVNSRPKSVTSEINQDHVSLTAATFLHEDQCSGTTDVYSIEEISLQPNCWGEVVLIGSDETKMMSWHLGRIEDIIPGRDGKIEVLQLRAAKGIIIRLLQCAFPLEVGVRPADTEGAEPKN